MQHIIIHHCKLKRRESCGIKFTLQSPFSKENRKRIEFILWTKVMFGARRFWWPFINRTHFPPSFTRKMCVSSYFFDVKSPSNFRGITRIPCGAHFHARASKTSAEDADWPNAILMFMVHRDALFNVFLVYYDKNGKKLETLGELSELVIKWHWREKFKYSDFMWRFSPLEVKILTPSYRWSPALCLRRISINANIVFKSFFENPLKLSLAAQSQIFIFENGSLRNREIQPESMDPHYQGGFFQIMLQFVLFRIEQDHQHFHGIPFTILLITDDGGGVKSNNLFIFKPLHHFFTIPLITERKHRLLLATIILALFLNDCISTSQLVTRR